MAIMVDSFGVKLTNVSYVLYGRTLSTSYNETDERTVIFRRLGVVVQHGKVHLHHSIV